MFAVKLIAFWRVLKTLYFIALFSIIGAIVFIGWGCSYASDVARMIPLYAGGIAAGLCAFFAIVTLVAMKRAHRTQPAPLVGRAGERRKMAMKRMLALVGVECSICEYLQACQTCECLMTRITSQTLKLISWTISSPHGTRQVRGTGSQATMFSGFVFYSISTFRTGP